MLNTTIRTAVAAALLAGAGAALAAVTTSQVHGRLRSPDDSSRARGEFHLITRDSRATTRDKIGVSAVHLDTSSGESESAPEYHVWLIDGDQNEADFGAMRLNRRGNARFKFDSRRNDFPSDISSVTQFGGGTLEVRDGETVVLSGSIPSFRALGDGDSPRSRVHGRDASRLRAVEDGSDALGRMDADYVSRPRGTRERVSVEVLALPTDAGPYTVVVIEGDGDEIELGEITTRGRRGAGVLRLDTNDAEIAGGTSVLDLAGLDVEVRDASGGAVLRGFFPTIE